MTNNFIQIKIARWFIDKNNIQRITNSQIYDGFILQETTKAILFKIHPVIFSHIYYSKANRNGEIWIPKSVIEVINNE